MPPKKLIVRKSAEIAAPPSRVWDILISPESWPQWMLVLPQHEAGAGRLQLGSKVFWQDDNGKPYLTGTVTIFELERALVLDLDDVSWTRKAKPGEVTYSMVLSPKQNGTQVEFTLGDLSIDDNGQQWHDAYMQSRELEAIKALAEANAQPKAMSMPLGRLVGLEGN